MTPDMVAAHLEIQQVLYRYCRGVDRGDEAMIASVYHPDGVDQHGPWKGLGRDFAPLAVRHMDLAGAAGQHHITNVLIDVRGDVADVESYYIALQPEITPEGPTHSLTCGRYLDRFEKRGGRWLIAERRVVMDVHRAQVGGGPWPGAPGFPAGGRRSQDASASMFTGAAKLAG
jgi:hypothetical protein